MPSLWSARPNRATLLMDSRSLVLVCKKERISIGVIQSPSSSFSAGWKWAEEELFQRCGLFKLPVGLFQDGFVGIVQPVAFTFGYGIHGLCVELPVVDGDIGMDGAGDFDADETAAAAGVCQQVFLVAGCYKGGVASYFLDGGAVRLAQVCHGFLQQML